MGDAVNNAFWGKFYCCVVDSAGNLCGEAFFKRPFRSAHSISHSN